MGSVIGFLLLAVFLSFTVWQSIGLVKTFRKFLKKRKEKKLNNKEEKT